MRGDDMRASDTPVWIIGGGKTAMDTAHALITEYPGREVNLVAGSGTFFISRDRFFPTGIRRWWGGKPFSSLGAGSGASFRRDQRDGRRDWFRDTYGTWLTPETGNFLLGVLSEAENKTIAAGLNDVVMDHFVDAVDRNGSTEMVLRSGATKAIQPGSWIVNCTGYTFKRDDHPYEPYVSASGAVVSIQPRSATLHLTSFMGYFLTHLLFLGKIRDVPLYELDVLELRNEVEHGVPVCALCAGPVQPQPHRRQRPDQGVHRVRTRFRPLVSVATPHGRHGAVHAHAPPRTRAPAPTLDTVRERFDVRCGPLT